MGHRQDEEGSMDRYDSSNCDFLPFKTPTLSCRSWSISDSETGKPLMWHRPKEILQPASITKVVTAMVVLDKCARMSEADKKKYLRQKCEVSPYAASFAAWHDEYGWNAGTNAKLKEGEWYTVRELLFALMLPSGNDAAICLAEALGMSYRPDQDPPPPPPTSRMEPLAASSPR
mmetsp:Transcript_39278/g.91491  ORF Transcript_39278/g.91491 Transcript_39278/m.91491 type:complete len:174 (-) Transcript_39278:101-622(-)